MEPKQENLPINEAEENITIEEVKHIMHNLARNKASGMDGVTNEILLAGKQQVIQSIWILCRMAWESEKIPEEWAKGLIVPIHKEGDKTIPDNYRGITLLSVVGKVYTAILTLELCHGQRNAKIVEEQADFCAG